MVRGLCFERNTDTGLRGWQAVSEERWQGVGRSTWLGATVYEWRHRERRSEVGELKERTMQCRRK